MRVVVAGGGRRDTCSPPGPGSRARRRARRGRSFPRHGDGTRVASVPAAGFESPPWRPNRSSGNCRPIARRAGHSRPLDRGLWARRSRRGRRGRRRWIRERAGRPRRMAREAPGRAPRAERGAGARQPAVGPAADVACVSFAESAALPRRTPTVVTGNPVRREILAVPAARDALASAAMSSSTSTPARRAVLIFGGSQGALRIDRAVSGAMELLRDRADLQLLVLTGAAHLADDPRRGGCRSCCQGDSVPAANGAGLRRRGCRGCRAGASTIAEVTVCGLPSILVPYPHATANHQEANARAVERAGASTIVRIGS